MELLVYKASAGSGKTFTLAVEYIKHLIRNPRAYRQILAVTFTNKATTEMKERILQQLYGIWQNDPDSAPYCNRILEDLQGSMFGEELRHAWDKANPGFILNTANLGWFTDAVLPQFTAMSAMRARETARPFLQAVQNAHSALIGPDGQIQRMAGKGAQNLDLTMTTMTGEATPFVRFGHWPVIALVLMLLAAAGWQTRNAARRRASES